MTCATCRHGVIPTVRPIIDPAYRHCPLAARHYGLPTIKAWLGTSCPLVPSRWESMEDRNEQVKPR